MDFKILMLFFISGLYISNVSAVLTEDSFTINSYDGHLHIDSSSVLIGQTFNYPQSPVDSIASLSVYAHVVGNPGNGEYKIYKTVGGLPGTLLYTGSLNFNEVAFQGTPDWVELYHYYETDLNVSAYGQSYSFSISCAGCDGSNYYEIWQNSGNPYSSGSKVSYSGSWSNVSGYDLVMHSYYNYGTLTSTTNTIYNLSATAISDSHITWNWTNPSSNYSHVMVYKNGAWVSNVSSSFHTVNFIGLDANTNYSIGTRSVSIDGIVNQTWVNATAKTMIECPVNSVCQLEVNTSSGAYQVQTNINWEYGNTFKLHSADSNYRVKQIDSIQMVLQKVGTPNNPCVEIYNMSGGLPYQSVGSDCGDIADVPDVEEAFDWVFVLTSPVAVQDNVEYAFAVSGGVDSSNALWAFGTWNTFPPYGQQVLKNASWYTDSGKEASFIIGYTLELVPEGQISYDNATYNIGTQSHITVNLTDPSWFWNTYFVTTYDPNGNISMDDQMLEAYSYPLSLSEYVNITGTWNVTLYECILGICIGDLIRNLGTDTIEVLPNYANGSMVQWLNATGYNNSVSQYNTTLINADFTFNEYYVVLKNTSGIQKSSSQVLGSYPNPLTWNVTLDEIGEWNITLIECVLQDCLNFRTLNYSTIQVIELLQIVSTSPETPYISYKDVDAIFSIELNQNVSMSWYYDNVSVGNFTGNLSNYTKTGVLGNHTVYVFANTSYENVSFTWNWTVVNQFFTVSGYVVNNESIGVNSALVDIFSYNSTSTNSDGYYLIENVLNGSYLFNASKTGYSSSSRSINVNANLTNQNFTIYLLSTPTPTPIPTITINPTLRTPVSNKVFFLHLYIWVFAILYMFIITFNDKS